MTTKRLLAIFLVFTMLFAVVGCKKTPDTVESTATPGNTGSTSTATDQLTATNTPDSSEESLTTTTPSNTDSAKPTPTPDSDFIFNDISPEKVSTFDDIKSVSQSGWKSYLAGNITLSKNGGVGGSQCLRYVGPSREGSDKYTYCCPYTNLYDIMKKAGTYQVSYMVLIGGEDADSVGAPGFSVIIRGNGAGDANSFIAPDKNNKNYRYVPSATIDGELGDWMTVEFELTVLESDLDGGSHSWKLCMHGIDEYATEFYIDNFQVLYAESVAETEKLITKTETWIANEMTFIAKNTVSDPVNTRTFDVEFTNGNQTIKMPGFWDGQNIWRVRFALPKEGTWTYKTIFSDASDSGVHNKKGTITVKKYSGNLDIYKHGFVTTKANTKYFVYADGTPFFYLGDTHWDFLTEEFDRAGSKAAGIQTNSHFKYIINKRISQGFTVYQSQPNNAPFNFTDGISLNDIAGLRVADKYFEYIADQGLVHANAQFFFASTMNNTIMKNYSQAEYEKLLDTLSRYWIARFGAYPVMYTLAQEIDNDYYYKENGGTNTNMNSTSNPWKFVCESLYKYDPYKNPISGHQEGSYTTSNYTTASNSAFRNTKGHTWWATQWKPVLNTKTDFSAAIDFWNNGQGKPAIMYEGRYDGLWTNEYGARAQGWLSFLNGMYGHGYGAVDIWLYSSAYDLDKNTVRDGITITVETKKTPWGKSIEFASGYQMGYMKTLLQKYQWWNLVPAFDNKNIFVSDTGYYSVAHIGTDLYIAYLYDNISRAGSTATGTFKSLDANAQYTYQWFNPRTAALTNPTKANKNGSEFSIGQRPSAEDWVLILQKTK